MTRILDTLAQGSRSIWIQARAERWCLEMLGDGARIWEIVQALEGRTLVWDAHRHEIGREEALRKAADGLKEKGG